MISRSQFPIRLILALSLVLPVAAITARADVQLPSLFANSAVLQRGIPIPFWGNADAGETVSVSIGGQKAQTTADTAGHWALKFPAQNAAESLDVTISGKNTIVLNNVAVGEVWVASGQSNMQFPLETWSPKASDYYLKAQQEISKINDPSLRMFTVRRTTADKPFDNVTSKLGEWRPAAAERAGNFSAVGYYFAVELRRKLNVPVGIIDSSMGATPAEAWTSENALAADPKVKMILEEWQQNQKEMPAAQKTYDEQTLPAWQKAADEAKAAGQNPPLKPKSPVTPAHRRPAHLFNAMLSPLIPYGIKGVIWYQGESNEKTPDRYRSLFAALILDWRTRWGLGDFPFFFVQLANYGTPQTLPVEPNWAPTPETQWLTLSMPILREAQLMTLSIPNTGMASAIDLADPENPIDVHPHNKQEVGRRLSLLALEKVYGQGIPSSSGPLFSGVKFSENQARLSFTHLDGGLVAKGEKLKGFAIADNSGKFVWADARIDGDTVLVSNPQVTAPTAVRYDWATNPIGNLYNQEGLPASPFRTDPESR